MADYIDTTTWVRREAFEYFKGFDKPYFNVCVKLNAAPLKAALAARGGGSFNLACHFLALRVANRHEPLRYRLQGGRVRIVGTLAAGATVLRDDGSFSFAYLPPEEHWPDFESRAAALIAQAKSGASAFDPRVDEQAVIHFTTLPWMHFSSFSHARNWGREDAVPKIAFGRADADSGRLWLPFSVEVHHALMDGLHLGRYVQDMEHAMAHPGDELGVVA